MGRFRNLSPPRFRCLGRRLEVEMLQSHCTVLRYSCVICIWKPKTRHSLFGLSQTLTLQVSVSVGGLSHSEQNRFLIYSYYKVCTGHPQTPHLDSNLCDNSGVGGDSQVCGTSERLSTGLHVSQVLAGAETLVLLKVSEELQQITREVGDGRLGDEAVDGHAAVGAGVQLPVDTVDGDGGNSRTGGGDGAGAAEGSKPDHDLVLLVAISGGAEEQVVGDISDDVGVGVADSGQQRGDSSTFFFIMY